MPIETVCPPVPTQSRQRNTLPSSIMWKVPITWRAALARPGRAKLAHVPRLGRAFLPRSIANLSPACTMMAHRRTLTPRCTLCTCTYGSIAETFIANTSIEAPPRYSNWAYHQHRRLAQRCEHPYQSSITSETSTDGWGPQCLHRQRAIPQHW